MPIQALLRTALLLTIFAQLAQVLAQNNEQSTKYWTGGSGRWSDASHWSERPDGLGGAGVPKAGERVVIAPVRSIEVEIDRSAVCGGLFLDAGRGAVQVHGPANVELAIYGGWSMQGAAFWEHQGTVRLGLRQGRAEIDLRGRTVAGDVVFDGSGSWSVVSDMVLADGRHVILRKGEVVGTFGLLKASSIRSEGGSSKLFRPGRMVVMLEETLNIPRVSGILDPGASMLVVAGQAVPWDVPGPLPQEGAMDINVCGTGPGQTPFIVNAQLTTNYNGFGVQCRGECNATITATVSQGVGPFTYQWLNGGPGTATWTTACGGPQIVIVTDVGQGISCPAQVSVTEPGPLGIIFFGSGTPPSCAGVCNGSRTALGVGGVPPITYNWNNGAGTSSSFSQLCPGLNTLVITDLNNCSFDTTFFYNVQSIQPNLSVTDVGCFGVCDGAASVAPSGGTGSISITWSPPPPIGQGTTTASGLCAGNYNVLLVDANGCDTTVTFAITQPQAVVPAVTSTNATCFGICNGSATASASGAPGPFTYTWSPAPGAGQGTGSVTGLCAGAYTVTIADQPSGCTVSASVTITSPPQIVPQATITNVGCAGACTGAVLLNVEGGTSPFSYAWSPPPPVGQGTPNASGLCVGSYTVVITDGAGCTVSATYTITAPPLIVLSLTGTNITCSGTCNGTATAAVSGGVLPFTYLWSPAPTTGQGTPNASGLCAGTYTLLVTDANGCTATSPITITEPPPLVATPSQTNVSCAGLCNGTATITASGGTPGYTYAWSPAPPIGQGTATASGLCAGAYSVVVTDAAGCTRTASYTILDATPIQWSLQLSQASCPGVCDGGAGVIATGGTAPYTYVWAPAPGSGQGTSNVGGLCAQAYTITVTDAVGCTALSAFTITEPLPIVAVPTLTDPTCAGTCNGSISLAPSGGMGTFTYLWSPVPPVGQGTSTVSSLCAGVWSVTITSGGCSTTASFTLNAPPPIVVTPTSTNVICAGSCNGTASVSVSGGTAPFTYAWTPAPPVGQGTQSVSGLCPGSWNVVITDAAGCTASSAFTITEPPPLSAPWTLTPAGCNNACAGTATVTPAGGIAPYIYLWAPGPVTGQGTNAVTGLCPGIYSVTVTDASGCSLNVPFTIVSPSGITAVPAVTPESCAGACDGAISVNTSGGSAPYTFTWDPVPPVGQGTPNVSGLCAGLWTLQINDAVACDTFMVVTITAPPAIVVTSSFTNETCNGPCDGTASVSVSGGVAPYTFSWVPAPPIGAGTPSASGLCAGNWSVTIADVSGCDTTVTFTILPEQPVMAGMDITNLTCAGDCSGSATVSPSGGVLPYTYVWSPPPAIGQGTNTASGLCAGNGQVTVTDAAGCSVAVPYSITAPPPLTSTLVTTPESCSAPCSGTATVAPAGGTGVISIDWQPAPGGGQGTSTATGLCVGTAYTVTLTDANGCSLSLPVNIAPFDPILSNSSSTPATCADACNGTATVGPTGGTAPYTYAWSPAPGGGQGTPQATGLCPGPVQVIITDANGCSTNASVLILSPPALVLDGTVSNVLCGGQCNGTIALSVGGGTAPYAYNWSPAPPLGQGTPNAAGLCAGSYSVVVTDAAGCSSTALFGITEPAPLALDVLVAPSQCQLCAGSAQIVLTGGTPFFSVAWTDAFGNVLGTSDNLSNLCAGIYFVTVTDGNGCTIQRTVPIVDSDGELLLTTDGLTSCPNSCDGSVSVAFNCSEPPCTISWADGNGVFLGQNGNTATGLCAGSYLVSVTNGLGCISIGSALVNAPVGVSAAISSTSVPCAGQCTGSATVGVSGGTAPYSFLWSPPPGGGQDTPFATGLCEGVYTVLVGDGGGCDTTFTVLITAPQPLALDAQVQGIGCASECNGSVAVTVSGGSAPFTFVWTPAPPMGQGTNTISGLCAGLWEVLVTDAGGCDVAGSYELFQPQVLSLGLVTSPSDCQACNGTASANATGGVGPLSYSWSQNGGVLGTDPELAGACSGLYTLTVTDAVGCSVQQVFALPDTDGEVLAVTDGQVTCTTDCTGEVSVSFTCGTLPCLVQWTDTAGGVLSQGSNTLGGLCPGDYTVQVTNGSGCVSFATATVAPTVIITPNLSSTPASCPGACDGTATAGPTGDADPYTFVWEPTPLFGQGTPQASGLCAGVLAVTITGSSGCDTTATVLILEPQPLAVSAVVSDTPCSATCAGAITVAVTGGTAPYTYAWSPEPGTGQGAPGISDLCPGSYVLTLTDAAGCGLVQSWEIMEPVPLATTGTSTLSECGFCNGTASVDIDGGVAPYFVIWTQGGAIYGTGTALSGLCAGLYVAEVIDTNGCSVTQLVPVGDVDGEQVNTMGSQVTCPGDCDGTASIDLNCSDPPCTIAWYDAGGNDIGQSGTQLSDLCAGVYLVMVTNATGCITIDTALVTSPDPIIPNLGTSPVSCFGLCDGVATVGPTGGTGSFTYSWDPVPQGGQGTPQATGLCAGVWSVTITDGVGCSIVATALILQPDLLSADISYTDPVCNGDCNGSVTLIPFGGVAPYSLLWDPVPPNGQGVTIATDLCPGPWSVIVTDANGCVVDFGGTLTDPPVLTMDLATTDNFCFGDCLGTAQVSISGGIAPYGIVWSDDQGNVLAQDVETVSDLCAGDLLVVITDASGCILEMPFSITEGPPIMDGLLVTNETCFGPCDGTAAVQPVGGQGGPYTILWEPPPPTGQGTTQASGLCAGPWSVTITDAEGCTSSTDFLVLAFVPIAANATEVDILCADACDGSVVLAPIGGSGNYTYIWDPVPPNGQGGSAATALCPGPFSVTITDGSGCSDSFGYDITEPPVLLITVDAVQAASCLTAADGSVSVTIAGGVPGYTFLWQGPAGSTSDNEDLLNVLPGDHLLTVTDANGCTMTMLVTVDALISVIANAGLDQEACTGTPLLLDGGQSIGAVTYTWTDDQGTVVSNAVSFTPQGLAAGDHTFTLTVTDGPCADEDQVTLSLWPVPIANAGPDQAIFVSGSVTLGGSPSGPQGSTFTWMPDSLLSIGSVPNPVASPLQTTWFVLSVLSPDGCSDTDSVLVSVVPQLVIPSGFTPNNDGWNDVWVIDFIDLFPNCEVQVYNRWGEQLFRSVGYKKPWDGRYNGEHVPVGTYYYVIELNDPAFPESFTGPLTVIR